MSNNKDMKPGDTAAWNWGGSSIEGQVTEKHTEKATIESKGKPITRKGEPDNPAFKVERKGKNPVIKKGSELHKTGSADNDEEEEEEELAEDDEAEEEGADLPEGKSSTTKVQTRRQKAIAEGKE